MAVRSPLKQPEKSAQRDPGEKGWTCYYCGKEDISSGIAPRHLSCPQLQVPSAKTKREYWRSDCSLRCRPQGSDSQDNLD